MPVVRIAESDAEFEQILELQRQYHVRTLDPEVQRVEGFVFAEHSLPLLRRMAAELPQAIALSDGKVVGYCLAMARALREDIPSLTPLFAHLEHCTFDGAPVTARGFWVGGQVCVDRAFRGQRLLARLYEAIARAVPPDHTLCVTEIAFRNEVSRRAHAHLGFVPISAYSDGQEEWEVVAWDVRRVQRDRFTSPASR